MAKRNDGIKAVPRPTLALDESTQVIFETPWKVPDVLRPFTGIRHKQLVEFDAPASIVATRIADCLRRRSLAAEFDNETASCHVLTPDHCQFVINLYQNVMEGIRIRGNTLTFHRTFHSLCEAAAGLDSGTDRRPIHAVHPLEWPRFSLTESDTLLLPLKPSPQVIRQVLNALEHVVQLLRKDRLECQQIGMEQLVGLTDVQTSGLEFALHAALAVLGAPITSHMPIPALDELFHEWILKPIAERVLPREPEQETSNEVSFSFSCATSLLGTGQDVNESQDVRTTTTLVGDDEHHGGLMRSMVLRAFTNALYLLEAKQPKILHTVLVQSPALTAAPLLQALQDDVLGASRPPAVVNGTRLASPHDAALAIRSLRIIGTHHDKAFDLLSKNERFLDSLGKAIQVGQAFHVILKEEAETCYEQLTTGLF